LKEALEMKSEDPDVHNNLGLSYFEIGNFEESKNCYNKAINILTPERLEKDEKMRKNASSYYSNYA